MHWLRTATLAAAIVLAACSAPQATPTPKPRTPAPAPTSTPTPGPDTETVTILAVGVGSFDLVAIPVVLLHNDAHRHGAAQVVVHFATASPGGSPLGTLQSVPVNIGPGETLPVTADCTDACTGAASTTATIAVGAWVTQSGATVTASPGTYVCNGCGGGRGHADVTATLSASLGAGAAVTAFAACTSASGAVIGGGSTAMVWQGGPTTEVDVPVIIDATPVACTVGASTGW